MSEIKSTTSGVDLFLNIFNASEITEIDSISRPSSSQIEHVVMIVSTIIASVGIVVNFTVIIVFLNDKKLRRKIHIYHQPGKLKNISLRNSSLNSITVVCRLLSWPLDARSR